MNSKTIINNPREKRKYIRKKFSYIEPLEEPGSIYAAKVHSSSQRLLNIHRITKYVKFCKCCSLPAETVGAVEPYTCGDNIKDFGFPIFLYFYYMKFCIIMSIIFSLLSSTPSIVFSKNYTDDLKKFCKKKFNITNIEKKINYEDQCYYFLSSDNDDIYSIFNEKNKSDVIQIDYLSFMSASHILRYRDIFVNNTKNYFSEEIQQKKCEEIFVEYSLMYFETAITVLIASFLLNLHVNMLDDYENYITTSPKDYAVLVHGVSPPKGNYSMKNQIIGIINEVSFYTGCSMEPYQIISCLRIGDIYNKSKKIYELETKIYHVQNLESQKKINREKGNTQSANNLCYYDFYGCFNKSTPIIKIQQNITKLQNELNIMELDLNKNPNKFNGGTYFIIFPQMKMRDDFYNFFPHSYGSKLICTIKYFFQSLKN